jgi:hypothetical protein
MNKTSKTEAAGSPVRAARFRGFNWRGLVRRVGRNHDPRRARPQGSQFTELAGSSSLFNPDNYSRRLTMLERAAANRRSGDPLLAASLTTFNQPRFYVSADWMPPLRLIVSGL